MNKCGECGDRSNPLCGGCNHNLTESQVDYAKRLEKKAFYGEKYSRISARLAKLVRDAGYYDEARPEKTKQGDKTCDCGQANLMAYTRVYSAYIDLLDSAKAIKERY